jgi:hypothetical protein
MARTTATIRRTGYNVKNGLLPLQGEARMHVDTPA